MLWGVFCWDNLGPFVSLEQGSPTSGTGAKYSLQTDVNCPTDFL